jgi:hypothetical protein
MIANTKYTALEILTAAGIEKPEEKFGKVRVRIGGIHGIVKPDHIIRIPNGTKEVAVLVGVETATIPLEEGAEAAVSESAQKAIEAKGALATEKAEALAKAKAKAKK